jgi:hypothetical protein
MSLLKYAMATKRSLLLHAQNRESPLGKTILTAEFDKARTDLAKHRAVFLPEVRNRLVIGSEPTQQPHDLDIASSFSFEPTAQLHSVQVAGNAKPKQNHTARVTGGRAQLEQMTAACCVQ